MTETEQEGEKKQERGREGEGETELPSSDSLPKWPHNQRVGVRLKAGARNILLVIQMGRKGLFSTFQEC